MPSVFTLESPTGFGAPVISQDYLELLGDPTRSYDTSVGHAAGIAGAMMGETSSFFAERGMVLGSAMAFGTAIAVGFVVGNAALYSFKKLGWKSPE